MVKRGWGKAEKTLAVQSVVQERRKLSELVKATRMEKWVIQ